MEVFHTAIRAGDTPPQTASHPAFYLATLLAGLSALLTARSGESQPLPLMLACCCVLLGLWKPMWFAPLGAAWYRLLNGLARGVLTLYWFVYILPAGLSMQVRGHDPLQRQFNPKSTTYWQEPQPSTDMRKLN